MSEGVEIERKFVVARLPEDLAGGGWRAELVEQGYLAITPDLEVRVRRRGSGQARHTTLTIKSAPALARVEEELALAAEAFERLWPLTAGRRLVKTRYVREAAPAVLLELDVYAGPLEGLATLEVEFADEATSRAFTPPPWAGREVTGDPAYANQKLAVHGRP